MMLDPWDWKTSAPEFVPQARAAPWGACAVAPAPMAPMCAAPGGPVSAVPAAVQSWYYEEDEWEDYSKQIRAAQVQARSEMQLRSKDEEVRLLQQQLVRREDETARMQADFERDRQGLLYNLNQLLDLESICLAWPSEALARRGGAEARAAAARDAPQEALR